MASAVTYVAGKLGWVVFTIIAIAAGFYGGLYGFSSLIIGIMVGSVIIGSLMYFFLSSKIDSEADELKRKYGS
jgi:hypothetical protein